MKLSQVCMYRKKNSVYRVQYYMQFQTSSRAAIANQWSAPLMVHEIREVGNHSSRG